MGTIAKIQLSPQETELVKNTIWLLDKQNIIKKVYAMFGELSEVIKLELKSSGDLFPGNIKNPNGKISKGENYKNLPYVILDTPAFFDKKNIFAIRTMFWWGNFFSVTLHLSGIFKEQFAKNDSELFSLLQKNNFFICINKDEWEHHFAEDNYLPASTITVPEFETINAKDFFKVAKKIPLSEWQNADKFIINCFREIIQLLQISYRAGKKDLLSVFPKAGSGL